jgi:glucose-1-phosphate cytidylyltransferase
VAHPEDVLAHGINDFVICCGYKGYLIKEYFANYFLHMSDVTFDMRSNRMEVHHKRAEPWNVTLVDTGEHTMTGGRLKRVAKLRGAGRGLLLHLRRRRLSDVDISATIDFHQGARQGRPRSPPYPPARFGALDHGRPARPASWKSRAAKAA